MLIKSADDKQAQLDALKVLLSRPDVEASTRRRIEQEIRNVGAGERGERDAAYEIEFHFGTSRNTMTIHDLRIECDGRVAQIDHLILNRLSDIWVCESKSFAEGVAINEHGEWSSYYRGRARGIASPIEQNKRHIAVLKDVFAKGLVRLPKRLGITLTPELRSLILVSNSARISRPRGGAAARVEWLDSVIKCEQLEKTIDRDFEARSPASMLKIVGRETVETLARQLAALHVPVIVDWTARFGLPTEPPPALRPIAVPQPVNPILPSAATDEALSAPNPGGSRRVCSACGRSVSDKIASYCETNTSRFGGAIFCWDCQQKVPR